MNENVMTDAFAYRYRFAPRFAEFVAYYDGLQDLWISEGREWADEEHTIKGKDWTTPTEEKEAYVAPPGHLMARMANQDVIDFGLVSDFFYALYTTYVDPRGGTVDPETGEEYGKCVTSEAEWLEHIKRLTREGKAYGLAQLDHTGKVPPKQLPSFVDDVREGYINSEEGIGPPPQYMFRNFYRKKTLDEHGDPIYSDKYNPEPDMIYIDVSTGRTYRWNPNIPWTEQAQELGAYVCVSQATDVLNDKISATDNHGAAEYEIDPETGNINPYKNPEMFTWTIKKLQTEFDSFNPNFHNSVNMYRKDGTNTAYASTALGENVEASGEASFATGKNTAAKKLAAFAEGEETIANGVASHAEGYYTSATGDKSHAEGRGDNNNSRTVAAGIASHAEGYITLANGQNSHAEGENTKAYGIDSHVEGKESITGKSNDANKGYYAHAEGLQTTAEATASHAEGSLTQAIGNYSHVEGQSSKAEGTASHAEGNTTAKESYSHAEGNGSISNKESAHAEGNYTKADGKYSHSEGNATETTGEASHAEGYYTKSTSNYSHAEGDRTKAEGTAAHSEGGSTTASGAYSHAEGSSTEASAANAHAEGSSTEATALAAHAEGTSTHATAASAHAEGFNTIASASQAHAEGGGTTASGISSHAEGSSTKAVGNYSHAEGEGTIANGVNQHVSGKYNIADATNLEIIGNGTSTTRANARTLDQSGNEWLAGKVTLGPAINRDSIVEDNDLTTKDYVEYSFTRRKAWLYKGTIGEAADNPDVTELPTEHSIGWTYKVVTPGIYSDKLCELDDMVVCVATDSEDVYDDWDVLQSRYIEITTPSLSISKVISSPSNSSTDAGLAEIDSLVSSVQLKYTFNRVAKGIYLNTSSNTLNTVTAKKSGTISDAGIPSSTFHTDTVIQKPSGGWVCPSGTTTSYSVKWTIYVTDERKIREEPPKYESKATNLIFTSKVKYGVAKIPTSINDAFLNGLSVKTLTNNALINIDRIDCSGPDDGLYYLWYAVPHSYAPNGVNFTDVDTTFTGGFELITTLNHKNESTIANGKSTTVPYDIYRSTNFNLGSVQFTVSKKK